MAELATIARPYAEALFKAVGGDDASSLAQQLDALGQVAAEPQLRQFADNPKASAAQVFDLMAGVAGVALSPKIANLLRTVIDNGRLSALPEVSAQFRVLVNASTGVSDALIVSAYPLDAAQLADTVATLEKRFGRKLNATVQVDESLIGGIRVAVGDEVLDTSVEGSSGTDEGRAQRLILNRPGNSAPSLPHSTAPASTPPAALSEKAMQLNPAEISELIKSRIEGLGAQADIRNQGTVVSVTDGIVRVHGLSDAMQGEMLEFPAGKDGQPSFGLALNLERDSVGAVILGEYEHISEGDTVKCTGRILEVPVGPELIGRVVNAPGPAHRRQGPDQRQDDRRDREGRPGRDRAEVGGPAGADRPEVDRLHGARRPWPARADHRRPPDRQDGGGDRRDHQPEGSEHDLHLRCDRPEGVVDQERGARSGTGRRDGLHHRRGCLGL